ncbi:MAG: phosphatase [Pseudonocardiales bacterium]|nr:MAG: phosphatase [Pseudonocardiales bacterium]
MSDADLHMDVLQALDHARPDAAITVLRPLLAERLQASQVHLLVANYQLTALRPIQDPDDRAPLGDTPAGEAFVSQLPVTRRQESGEAVLYLPVSIRGDRLGVLQLAVPTEPSPPELDRLGELGTVIGYALQAAARQTDAVERAARSQRLTLAAELQWQLLPGRGCRGPEYQLAGHLEPAYHVHADNYDWSQDGDQLVLSVTDAAGHDRSASLLTTLAVTALRNARRAELELADQAAMADQAVYAHHQGKQYVSTLLVRIDLTSGRATAVRAGSPRLFILRGGDVLVPPLVDQLPLGMFDGTDYLAEHFALANQDRLLLVSDGIHAAVSPTRERFADERLPQLLRATASLPVGGVVRRVIEELFAHRDLAELDDDAAVICLDWVGPGSADPSQPLPHAGDAWGRPASRTRRLSIVPDGEGGERDRHATGRSGTDPSG